MSAAAAVSSSSGSTVKNESVVITGDDEKKTPEPSSNTSTNAVAPTSRLLDVPTEISASEYADLLQQIVANDLTDLECGTELLDAARYNDIDVVRALLKVHYDNAAASNDEEQTQPLLLLQYQDGDTGNTALHMAAANGHVEICKLLLDVEAAAAAGNDDNNDNKTTKRRRLVTLCNQAGNTALHWAAANGQDNVVELLCCSSQQSAIDVLQRNKAGRSALTEGFSSQSERTIQLLLEHESASEEKLVATSSSSRNNTTAATNDGKQQPPQVACSSVTHELRFAGGKASAAGVNVKIRELPINISPDDSILGQDRPEQDTTGFGIWASSLVLAQWMSDIVDPLFLADDDDEEKAPSSSTRRTKTVLELGAGCGVPGLVVAASLSSQQQQQQQKAKVYLTDFNPTTVENLKHNIQLNKGNSNNNDNVQVEAHAMNWQDRSTFPTACGGNDNEKIDVVIGSDLIYQSDMVPLLLQTLQTLAPARFLYAAPTASRQGHETFVSQLTERMQLVEQRSAPTAYTTSNPLVSGDDEECFLHFHELQSAEYTLYDFRWKNQGSKEQLW